LLAFAYCPGRNRHLKLTRTVSNWKNPDLNEDFQQIDRILWRGVEALSFRPLTVRPKSRGYQKFPFMLILDISGSVF
jgi:hypothetical protein